MNLLALQFSPEQIAAHRLTIRQRMLAEAPCVRQPDFIRLADTDIALLFRLYDQYFFASQLHPLLSAKTNSNLRFRSSGAMSSSGGKATRFRQRQPDGTLATWYEIAISAKLLFASFRDPQRAIHVSGHLCTDRLDAMQRIMEHEIIHLAELLTFGKSSCSRSRFMTLAQRIFAHSHPRHRLVTPRERAATQYQLQVGQSVEFPFQGQTRRGFVNRLGTRATILCPDSSGQRYSDGHYYAKFYVPLACLRPLHPLHCSPSPQK